MGSMHYQRKSPGFGCIQHEIRAFSSIKNLHVMCQMVRSSTFHLSDESGVQSKLLLLEYAALLYGHMEPYTSLIHQSFQSTCIKYFEIYTSVLVKMKKKNPCNTEYDHMELLTASRICRSTGNRVM